MNRESDPMRLKDLSTHSLPDQARAPDPELTAPESADGAPPGEGRPQALRKSVAGDLTSTAALCLLGLEWRQQLLQNVRGARRGSDPEFVHQLRVGLRRLRGLLGLLARQDTALPPVVYATAVMEMRWIAAILGRSRDLDVFVGHMLPAATAGLAVAEADRLRHRALRLRLVRCQCSRAALESERFDRLASLLQDIFELAPAPTEQADHLGGTFKRALKHQAATVRRRGSRTDRKQMQTLHRLRVETKTLRYLAELAAPMSRGKKATAYVAKLAALQADLGRLQDLTAAQSLFAHLTRARAAEAPTVPTSTATPLDALAAEARRAIAPALRAFRQSPPFWKSTKGALRKHPAGDRRSTGS